MRNLRGIAVRNLNLATTPVNANPAQINYPNSPSPPSPEETALPLPQEPPCDASSLTLTPVNPYANRQQEASGLGHEIVSLRSVRSTSSLPSLSIHSSIFDPLLNSHRRDSALPLSPTSLHTLFHERYKHASRASLHQLPDSYFTLSTGSDGAFVALRCLRHSLMPVQNRADGPLYVSPLAESSMVNSFERCR